MRHQEFISEPVAIKNVIVIQSKNHSAREPVCDQALVLTDRV